MSIYDSEHEAILRLGEHLQEISVQLDDLLNPRFEYEVYECARSPKDAEILIREYAAQGWRLAALVPGVTEAARYPYFTCVFERRIREP